MKKRDLIWIGKISTIIAALFVAYNVYFHLQSIDNPLKRIFYIMSFVFLLLSSIALYMSRRMDGDREEGS